MFTTELKINFKKKSLPRRSYCSNNNDKLIKSLYKKKKKKKQSQLHFT